MSNSEADWWRSVVGALASGQKIASTSEQFDRVCQHIVRSLTDSSLLLESGSPATATFLSITAIEEVAKVHIGMYRQTAVPVARRRGDPLFRHDQKHRIAAAPTIAMGSRLKQAIGEDRVHQIVEQARSGGLVQLREACLYVEQKDTLLHVPIDTVSTEAAREMLLFAIEVFDDALVGYTNQSFVLGRATDLLFAKWKDV